MPRPPVKRRKSNSHHPTSPKRVQSNAGGNNPRVKLQQKLANKVIGQRPSDSDDSDRLVTRTRHGRNKRTPDPIYASGGVAKGDQPGVFPTKEERMRRLRSDTEEILRRSRSKSIEASKERLAQPRSSSASNGVAETVNNIQQSAKKSPKTLVPSSQPTPGMDKSILSNLKPRKRQPSILRMIDNDESSLINPEDEDQFLPDDESTPLNTRTTNVAQPSESLTTGTLSSVSRKRKLGSDEPISIDRTTPASSVVLVEATQEDPVSLPSTSPKYRAQLADEDDIMAPPQSSSPEPSPKKPKPTKTHKKTVSIPTTEQLQTLMPSKRRKGDRQRKPLNEFDIPEETSSPLTSSEEESAFLPTKRPTRLRNPKSITKPSSRETKKSTGPKSKTGTGSVTPAKPRNKSTRTPLKVPTTPRTPLPLTRNANQENKTLRSSKPSGAVKNDSKPDSVPASSKPSGGSHLVITGAESDKENTTTDTPARTTRSSRKRASPVITKSTPQAKSKSNPKASMVVEDIQPSIELDSDVDMLDPDTDSEQNPGTAEVKAWKNKWKGIDDWDLEFEEVSASTGGSSPVRVSVA